MKFVSTALVVLVAPTTIAFHVPHHRQSYRPLFSTATTTSVEFAKQDLISTAERLKHEYGVFIVDKTAKQDLKQAVEELENSSEPPTLDNYVNQFLGDWTLVCTTASSIQGIDTQKLPFWNQGPLKEIRDSIQNAANKYVRVEQNIRSTNDDGVIDRVDHVIAYQPPEELRDVLDKLPEQLSTLKINPLHVSKSKVSLIHKASVLDTPPLRTKLSLQSVVLNVAGTSTILDPEGQDVAGINFPLGEFINTGEFETTYMDEDVRISRGKQGFVDQLRVFVRTDRFLRDEALEDIRDKGTSVGMGVDSQVDVDEVVDSDFIVDEDEEEEENEDDTGPVAEGGSNDDDLTPSA